VFRRKVSDDIPDYMVLHPRPLWSLAATALLMMSKFFVENLSQTMRRILFASSKFADYFYVALVRLCYMAVTLRLHFVTSKQCNKLANGNFWFAEEDRPVSVFQFSKPL
jgi:hypothetical protein